ncbi:MTOR-associated protein MEAK7-like [Saccostrea echinata]|uniref:MTOR-associated protein MEAK7-like n=1 Tax=Saccostrea echinata TaxID=191078 RepID=UPI002A812975|nr:MTOR-associated protein MEAK7-like [Saccostrea echinata]
MGGSESKESAPPQLFTQGDVLCIHSKFDKLFKSTHSFQEGLVPLNKELSRNLYQYISHIQTHHHSHQKHKQGVTVQQFQVFVSHALKGTYEEKAAIFCGMKNSTQISATDVSDVTISLLEVYKHYLIQLPHWRGIHALNTGVKGDKQFVSYLTKGLTASGENWNMCISDIETWMSKTPHFMNIFDTVCSILFQFENKKEILENISAMVPIPVFVGHRNEAVRSVLDHNSVLFLNYNLPIMHQSHWRFLFSNSVFGDSFSQLLSQIINKGPTLLVIRDKKGHLFGGMAADSWECRAKFYGSSSCFLFTLSPQYGIYTPTMYNENFMYLNQGQATLLNGLGMGGQMDYFGLWIDSSFNHGHSKAKPKCTTYGSPQLSADPEFEVDVIEVWALGPEKKNEDSDDEGEQTGTKKSILQSDPESKAMLELLGKTQASEGFREHDEDDDQSEEMKRKMNTIPKLL